MKLVHQEMQYIEFLSNDLERIKDFYQQAFGWSFTDYGPEYTAFTGQFVDGGFGVGEPQPGSILPVVYSQDLEGTLASVELAGGEVVRNIFSFPGGRRFHFIDPDGNELAVWSDSGIEDDE
tara:strand:+ start:4263 stop:4625 length:363 start_codon:yes stop_codon:yes gene_type:complete